MNYEARGELVNNLNANNPKFRQLVEGAIAEIAQYLCEAGATATIKTNASRALASPAAEVNRFAWYCAFDATIAGVVDGNNTVSDAQVYAVVNAKAAVAWAV